MFIGEIIIGLCSFWHRHKKNQKGLANQNGEFGFRYLLSQREYSSTFRVD
jgi:hypothetical protein